MRQPRYHVHFTPTSASWINQAEHWFAELTRKQLRRGVHTSMDSRHVGRTTNIELVVEGTPRFQCGDDLASLLGGRPPLRPRRLAAASPAMTRSRVIPAHMVRGRQKMENNSNSPCSVVVSICSVREPNATPRFLRLLIIVKDNPRLPASGGDSQFHDDPW